jgi:putative salt-induced outer membrane protein
LPGYCPPCQPQQSAILPVDAAAAIFQKAAMRPALLSILLFAAPAMAEPIPPAVAAMIDAAANPDQLRVVAEIARKTNPNSVAEIDARVAAINTAAAKAREEKLASQRMFQGWTGNGELGGFISSGNTENRGLAIGVNLTKETRRWKHAARGQVDYQEDQGIASRERFFAGYEGHWKFSPRGFAVLALNYERDRFTGFASRFSQALGLGYRLVDSRHLTIALDGGPALRQTLFTTGAQENVLAARAAVNGKWVMSRTLTLSQTATYYADNVNSSLLALSQFNARLNGRLSARLSVQLNNESNPPPGRENTDTVTRATLVYNF